MGRFSGHVAIVAGASTNPGIGRSCALRLGREGARVVINARNADRLRATAEELRAEGVDAVCVAGSMGDDDVAERAVATALDSYGRIDLLVNAVGGAPHIVPTQELTRTGLLDTYALNLWPGLALTQEAMRHGLADGGGAVVNISSGSPKKTTPTMGAYAAAKAALNALTRTLANDLARYGVRVNAVSPGLTKTMATTDAWQDDGGAAAGAHYPLGRLPEADDIAAAAAFLLSADAAAITGVLLDVDGGNHLSGGGWTRYS